MTTGDDMRGESRGNAGKSGRGRKNSSSFFNSDIGRSLVDVYQVKVDASYLSIHT